MKAAMTSPAAAAAGAPPLRGPGRQDFRPRSRFGPVGLAVMVGAHLALGWALASGLAGQAIEMVKKPLDATLIQELKLPPPPPPPPPKLDKRPEPPPAEPPPAYVPPPEVAPAAAPAAPAITAVQSAQPVAPPPPAPPAPPPAPALPQKADIALACPKQVRPQLTQRQIDEGVEGTVRAEIHLKAGKVAEVRIVAGPRVYHAAVRAAVMRYECVSGDGDVVATQDFSFKFD